MVSYCVTCFNFRQQFGITLCPELDSETGRGKRRGDKEMRGEGKRENKTRDQVLGKLIKMVSRKRRYIVFLSA